MLALPPDLIDLIYDFIWMKERIGRHTYWNRIDLFHGIDSSPPEPDPWVLPMVSSDY